MAKISTYPGPSSPSLSDMLIGTDVNDMNMTKNFSILDILSVSGSTAYVPYIGATNNVDLGSYTLTTDILYATTNVDTNTITFSGSSFVIADTGFTNIGLNIDLASNKYYLGDTIGSLNSTTIVVDDSNSRIQFNGSIYTNGSVGTSGQILTSQGAGLPATWALPIFVPYTGATGDVDLGAYRLTATSLRIITDDAEMAGITPISAVNDYFEIGSWGWNASGLLIDFVNNRYFLGDRLNIVNGTYLKVDDANSRIEISNALYTNGSVGAVGEVLTSQGAGLPATWATIGALAYVPYTGAVSDVDLGIYKLTADRLVGNLDVTTPVVKSNSPNFYLSDPTGTFSGLWFDYANYKYYIGDIAFQLNGTILTVDDFNNRVELNSQLYTNGSSGTSGQLLQSQGAGLPPTWTSIPSPILYHGSFYHTATITAVAPNVAYPLPVNSTDVAATNGVSIVTGPDGPTRITYANDGVYNIQFSAQLKRLAGGSTEAVFFWLRKNGTAIANNIPWTSTRVDMKANQGYLVAAWNFFVDINAGDWIELCWTTSSITIDIESDSTVLYYPAVPSLIITTNKVS
jgi:hypothetical protein